MKKKILLSRRFGLRISAFSLLFGLLILPQITKAQLTKNYATVARGHSTGAILSGTQNVPDFANASDGVESTAATLNSATTLALISTYSYVEIGFGGNVPSGATVYIPVQDDTTQGLLNTLAGGTLGNLVTGLLGDQYIEVTVKNNTGAQVVQYSSQNNGTRNFAQGRFNVVKDANGQQYITFKAAAGVSYDRISIAARTSGLVAASYQLKVQDAYYLSGAYDPCAPFLTTSIDATGVTVGLLNSSGYPVQNPQRVIDSDTSNYSSFGYGLASVGIGSTFSQDIYYSNLSKPGDQVKLRVFFPSSLLSANVLNTITVSAYRNDTLLRSVSLSSVLNAQLLALITINLNNNIPAVIQIPVDTTLAQSQQFDRVRVTYLQLANGSLNEFMRLYSVERVPPPPQVPVPPSVSCPGVPMHLSITNVVPGTSYKWYNSSGAVVSTDTFYNVTVPANGVTDNYSVTASTCPGVESIGTIAAITGTNAQCVEFSPIAYLQGVFDGTQNKPVTPEWAAVLAAHATTQPYNTPAFQYNGTESVAAGIFTSTAANTDIVDWVLLEIKDSVGTLIDRKAVFVLENGQVTNLDKSQPVVMKALPGKYYLTVRHRNHLGLSSNLTAYGAGENIFDFTSATDASLYGDANAFVVMNGKTTMIGGDANSTGATRYNGLNNDRAAILSKLLGVPNAVLTDVYTPEDLNLDGTLRYNNIGNDRALLLSILGGTQNAVIVQQIR